MQTHTERAQLTPIGLRALQAETWTAADAETMELDRSEDRAKLDVSRAKPWNLPEGLEA